MSASTPQSPPGRENLEQALLRAQSAAQAKRFGEAGGICNDVLAAAPHHPAALAMLGIVHAHTGHIDRAIALLEQANKHQPGVAAWQANLCSLYRTANRLDEALAIGQQAIKLAPDNPDALVNLSLVFTDLDDRERAIACLLRAVGLNPSHADARLALAQNLLARGEFEPGWLEYEWRNETEAGKGLLPKITSAPWNGMHIRGGRILLIGDQGYGDTIQFSRYIPMVAKRCEEILLGCSAELAPLIARIPGVSQHFNRWNEIPGHAAYCRLSSLPLLFRTTLETIPSKVPYLTPDPERVRRWGSWLAERNHHDMVRVGLAWSGRPTHPNDRRRSVRLSSLLPLSEVGRATFVSLQKPMPPSDMEMLGRFPGLTDLSAELTDFEETAALIASLDLVISVDTAVGHLAGALNKPAWIMLPKAPDFRWLLARSDSPWYSSVRLFRQQKPGAWNAVITEVTGALADELRSPRRLAAD